MPLGGLIPYDGSPYQITIKAGDQKRGQGQSGPQAPVSGPAAGMGSLQPPAGVGAPQLPAPPVAGPPVLPGGIPPVVGGPAVPPQIGAIGDIAGAVGGGLPPGVGLSGPAPALPQNIDWQALLPLLLQLRGGGGPLGGGPLGA